MIGLASKRRFGVLVALAAATLAGGPAFAQGHGGGGHGGGGGGHFSGGGGHSFGGGGSYGGGGRSFGGGAPRFAGGGTPRFAGGGARFAPHISAAPHMPAAPGAHYSSGFAARSGAHVGYAPRPGFSSHASVATRSTYVASGTHGYVAGRAGYGRPGYGRPGPGYGHPGWYRGGYHGYHWGGGYWNGAFWPRVYYGWGFPLFLPVLPAIYATYYWGGIPYYYANNVYYTWNPDQNGYAVTDPPPVDGTSASADNSNAQPASSDNGTDVYAYPQNGQTEEQQSNDRYECHTWARSQTGFDPTVSNSTGNAGDYRRAMIACMNARGYSSQ